MATKLDLQNQIVTLTERLCNANKEISFLREKLAERDHLARKLIANVNRVKNASPRRLAMLAAREAAMKSGTTTKVGGANV